MERITMLATTIGVAIPWSERIPSEGRTESTRGGQV